MPTTYEVVAKSDGGYKYRIIKDGNTEGVQEYKPGTSGYKDMTQAEAKAFASAIATEKNTIPVPVWDINIKPRPTLEDRQTIRTYITGMGYNVRLDTT